MRAVERVAIVGGGVIGAGWAARMALSGLAVSLYDPEPAGERVEACIKAAQRAWQRLGVEPARPRLEITTDLDQAVGCADFVQEAVPERLELKQHLFAQIDARAPSASIIASSTSGLLPSLMQRDMAHPERLVVGHPFVPPYLMPLVEVCGGERTSAAAIESALAFYRRLGMHALHVRREIDGFIADRMMEALWREALGLVAEGVATAEEIDRAITYGPGLRWAFFGPFMTYRVAGGRGGMRHFMEQFGPTLKLPWTRLTDTPELTPELLDTIVAQSDEQAKGRPIAELERLRDDCLIGLVEALGERAHGAGLHLPRVVHDER